MKTSEEIKKGLECCHTREVSRCVCEECPYSANGHQTAICDDLMAEDAIDLLYQREVDAKIADIKRDVAFAKCEQLESQVPKWISVEERLPEDEEYVLCWYKDEFGDEWSTVGLKIQWGCGWDLDIDDGSGRNFTVTHWMPLPEPPKEE